MINPVTFVLPGDGRSGGVRVTVLMANLLRSRGHTVRIACRKIKPRLVTSLAQWYRRRGRKRGEAGFLYQFEGQPEFFSQLADLSFTAGEIVIAVGTYSVASVRELSAPVHKVRFNHGFPAKPSASDDAAWRGRMPTITVSRRLVPRLQELTDQSVWGVVPNGIDTKDYFPETGVVRDGIGALYNRHPNKAPEDLIAVLQEAHQRWPEVPQYVFGTEARPAGLEHVQYHQLPSVADARRLYNRCRSWVLTSRTEGLPGVVLEAMACGCLVVSTDNDGSLEIIQHRENGLIAPVGDRSSILMELGRSLQDESLRATLLTGSAATIAGFTWDRAADQMEKFLSEVSSWVEAGAGT